VIFWDSSAVLPLLVWEPETKKRESQLRAHPVMAAWWGTRIECHSAIRRKEREGGLSGDSARKGLARLEHLASTWFEVNPSEALRLRSERLLKAHPLRAADALQLGAALLAFNEKTAGEVLYTSDERLAGASEREGFRVG
jgi:predicted nucleic acid-binding protein